MPYVWGVGTSPFGKQPTTSAAALAWSAVVEALDDAGTPPIDAVYVGSCFGEPGVAQRVLLGLGLVGLPIYALESACASSTVAFHEAVSAVATERWRTALVLGVEHLTSRFSGAIPVEARDAEGRSGLGLPGLYALSASRYKDVHGLTDRHLAQVSVKNHAHGEANPRAPYGMRLDVDEVLRSPMIADPLTLLQCCPVSDGAAAVVVGHRRRDRRDVPVLATALRSGGLWDHRSSWAWSYELARDTARDVYEATSLAPADVDLFEVHDAFTIGEIVTTEALGLAPPGDGAGLLDAGHTAIGGRQPVNPSGGLLSRGHPLGATGAAQVVEVVHQLRGECGPHQVDGAARGLVETLGGGVSGLDGNTCVVAALGEI